MTAIRADHKVLILAGEAMAAALVAQLVELAWLQPAFANSGESADQALARVKPILAVLIDTGSDAAGSDLFLARTRGKNVQTALFCGMAQRQKNAAWAREREIPIFVLPQDVDVLQNWLRELAARPTTPKSRKGERRVPPTATRDPSGTLIFVDGTGTRWSVYDRRAMEDRRKGAVTERHFVNDFGEDRSCRLAPEELSAITVEALRDQLARARP